jgi:CubicO group peptidase (beta-lactamase class C family)
MKSTRFDNAVENGAIRASENIPYRATNYQWDQGMQKRFEFLFGNWTYSAGGLFSTAADIAKFIVALDAGRLLKPTSLEQMWASQKLGNGEVNSFGAGWVVKDYSGRRTVGHSGGPALSDILRFRDEKLTIVVLTNQQRLYPYLARGIADILIPPPAHKPFSGITDNDLQTTALLKKVLSDAAEGRVDPLLFSDEAQKGFVPSFKEFGPLVFGGFEPLQSFVLVEDKQNEDKKVRRYAALYGKKLVTWSFNLTRENKIESFEPKME